MLNETEKEKLLSLLKESKLTEKEEIELLSILENEKKAQDRRARIIELVKLREAKETMWKTLIESGLTTFVAQNLLQELQDRLKFHIEDLKI